MTKKWVKICSIILSGAVIVLALILITLSLVFPLSYKNYIKKYCQENELDKGLVASIIYVESRFNKNAKSSKGAIGLMQLLPATAQSFENEQLTTDMLYNPETNIKIGTRFLKYLFEKYGDEVTVLACYNAGETAARKWFDSSNKIKLENITFEETKNYVLKVRKMKKYYQNLF